MGIRVSPLGFGVPPVPCRVCEVRAVDGSAITAFTVHECEGSRRVGSRPRRRLLTGHANGSLQLWDLSTAMEMGGRPQGTAAPQQLSHLPHSRGPVAVST